MIAADALRALVEAESPSGDPGLCAAAGRVLADVIGRAPDEIAGDGREHYLWRFGPEPRVLLVGHIDTVWPAGTLARWPFAIGGDRATGPGCFDMKAGLVVAAGALRALGEDCGATLLVTSDEETGSTTSRALIEREARAATAALVLEPGVDGALKVARKGVGMFRVVVHGRAAHAGLEPERGVNALVEAAHHVLAAAALAAPERGTTVTPTVATAGTTTNVVPAQAAIDVDVRVTDAAEAQRVEAGLRALAPVDPRARVEVLGGMNRPPLPRSAAEGLYALACEVAAAVGVPAPGAVEVGGGSDGNFTAALGVPTLDGLGPSGGNAHAEGEWVALGSIEPRTRLLAALVERLARDVAR